MDRALLLSVSDDMSSSWGMRFVAGFFKNKKQVRCTVLYIAPSGYTANISDARVVLTEQQVRKGQTMVAMAKQWLVERGFPESNVTTKVLTSQCGVVKDIITEAQKGLYDAVIVGRRYLDWMEMLYTTSVSRGVLWESMGFPVWVCNQPDPERNNILLCADGSESASHIADHVGFMMAHVPEQRVTVLHLRSHCVGAEEAIAEARQRIIDNGIEESRISTLVTDGQDKVETIVRLAHEGNYAVVAVGRRPSLPESIVQRLFTRSVSLRLHENIYKFSMWVSR